MKRVRGIPRQSERQRQNSSKPKAALTEEDLQNLAHFVRILEGVQRREELKQEKEKNNEREV
jgi:hypothetical protein